MSSPAMSYELHAVVASPEALTPIVERFDHAHPALLDGGELAMVPMCADLFAAIDLVGFPLAAESGFERLSPGVAAVLTAASRYGPVAYLECDYVGGIGWQTAAVWLDCQVVFGPRLLVPGEPFPTSDGVTGGAPIARALRYLGVEAIERHDEFVVLGLGRHRSTDEWCATGSAR